MLKFKVLSKVHSFHFRGKRYFPGEIVECSEEAAVLFNLDFLERVLEPKLKVEPESAPSAEVFIVDVATEVAILAPEVKAETLIFHPEAKSKVKSKTLPKVPL
jgi:hypothetical protein